VDGVSLRGLPANRIVSVLDDLVSNLTIHDIMNSPRKGQGEPEMDDRIVDDSRLKKLSFAECHLELRHPSHVDSLLSVLARCRSIVRLDLSGTLLDGRLHIVLAVLGDTVEYLCLSDCRLELEDVDQLLSSSTCRALRDLDLSYVYSTQCIDCDANTRAEKKLRRWIEVGSRQKLDPIKVRSVDVLVTGNADNRENEEDIEEDSGLSTCSRSSTLLGSQLLSDITGSRVSCEDSDTETSSIGNETNDENRPRRSASTRTLDERSEEERDIGGTSCRRARVEHDEDRCLVSHLIRSLSVASTLADIAILDIANDCFRLRLPNGEFDGLVETLRRTPRLRHLSIESFPLWDDDIVTLVEKIVEIDRRPTTFQSLAVTRSAEVPVNDDVIGRCAFWERLEGAKRGWRLRISIGNYLGTEIARDDDV